MTHVCVYKCDKHNSALNMHVSIDYQWVGKATLVHGFLKSEHFQEITKVLYGNVEGQELTVRCGANSLCW